MEGWTHLDTVAIRTQCHKGCYDNRQTCCVVCSSLSYICRQRSWDCSYQKAVAIFCVESSFHFYPVAIQTLGPHLASSLNFISDIGKRITHITFRFSRVDFLVSAHIVCNSTVRCRLSFTFPCQSSWHWADQSSWSWLHFNFGLPHYFCHWPPIVKPHFLNQRT